MTSRPLEVINVDNGSRDETAGVLDMWESRAAAAGITTTRLRFETNIGAVRGRNEALKVAGGEFIAFLDNDTVIAQAGWLDTLAHTLRTDANFGIAVPMLLFPWAPYQVECCGCAVSPAGRIQYLERGAAPETVSAARDLQCAISAAWLMPRRLMDEIGVLDETFSPVQYEDLDYCYRARKAGYSVRTVPAARVYHFEHTTTAGSDDINFRYVTTRNGLLFKSRWSRMFQAEQGTTEGAAAWKSLPKQSIAQVDWRALLPRHKSAAGKEMA